MANINNIALEILPRTTSKNTKRQSVFRTIKSLFRTANPRNNFTPNPLYNTIKNNKPKSPIPQRINKNQRIITQTPNNRTGVCFSCQYGENLDFVMPCCKRLTHKSCVLDWMGKRRSGENLQCPYCRFNNPLKYKDILLDEQYKTSKANLLIAQESVWLSFAPIQSAHTRWISGLELPYDGEIRTAISAERPKNSTNNTRVFSTKRLINALKVIYALLKYNPRSMIRDPLFTPFLDSVVSLHFSYNAFIENYYTAYDNYAKLKTKPRWRNVFTNEHKNNVRLFSTWNNTTLIIGILNKYPPTHSLPNQLRSKNNYPPLIRTKTQALTSKQKSNRRKGILRKII
jgi:hypothetical protein